jgi:hypothetical protein
MRHYPKKKIKGKRSEKKESIKKEKEYNICTTRYCHLCRFQAPQEPNKFELEIVVSIIS